MGNSTSKVDLSDAPASSSTTTTTTDTPYDGRRNLSRQSLSGSGSGSESPLEPGSVTRPSSAHSRFWEEDHDQNPKDAKNRLDGRRLSILTNQLENINCHDDDDNGDQKSPHPLHARDQESEHQEQQQHEDSTSTTTTSASIFKSGTAFDVLRRPPGMPLPIDNAPRAPGSPILSEPDEDHLGTFEDLGQDVDAAFQEDILDQDKADPDPLLSGDLKPNSEKDIIIHDDNKSDAADTANTEGEDEEEEKVEDDNQEDDEVPAAPATDVGEPVKTVIEWHEGGDNVFVTGTFVSWARKFRLRQSPDNPNVMSITLPLRPGTHHFKFIVDEIPRQSDRLPIAVDITNHLVNYIEVVRPHHSRGTSVTSPVTCPPSPLPLQQSTTASGEFIPPRAPTPNPDQISLSGQQPPSLAGLSTAVSSYSGDDEDEAAREIAPGDMRRIIPPLLEDIDVGEDTPSYQRAADVIGDMTTPPTQPLFLAKSILNERSSAEKDDGGVLNYPNHTVLNHLATSSLSNDVLALSVTTRHKGKYLTTILYKSAGVEPTD